MPVNIQADLRAFDKQLERLVDLHPEAAGKTLRRQVVLLAIDIMERTPPGIGHGLTPAARQEGQAAVARDIRKVYPSARKLSAGQIASSQNFSAFQRWATAVGGNVPPDLRAMSATITGRADTIDKIISGKGMGDFLQLQRLMGKNFRPGSVNIMPNFRKSYHTDAKGSFGKVPDSFRPNTFFTRIDGISSYRNKVQARVGKLKAGWFAAIQSLPGAKSHRKIPAWIKSATEDSSGYSEDNSSAAKMIASVSIANRIADKNGVSTRVSAISSALSFRARMMVREYDEALKDIAKNSSKK